ncbi:LADA_0H02498g1_1 [Lachancea dasiensis]|uniref:LADA_0H02498g1_1 n=1 Tax=Lachancea dasiensis TaxID=1072105 RepID=A0A1G4JZV0_9SACH|nr:LADA_0H02498g1_1 [Lachancea dasiensis]
MGIFTKKVSENRKDGAKCDTIKRYTVIKEPPRQYGKCTRPEPLQGNELACLQQVIAHFEGQNLASISAYGDQQASSETTKSIDWRPLSLREKLWLSRERLLKFLRSVNWDVTLAIKRLENTLQWRREFNLSAVDDETSSLSSLSQIVATENETGKMYLLGYDRQRRPLLHIKPGRQNTAMSFAQIQLLVYMIECADILMAQGVETLTLLVDFKNYNELTPPLARLPPLSVSKQVLYIIQQHYPETLGRAVLSSIPFYSWNFLKLFHPFLEPQTRSKLIFEEPFENYVDNSQLEILHNGQLDFSYDNDIYLSDLSHQISERERNRFNKFLDLGARIGLSEFDLKDGHYVVD